MSITRSAWTGGIAFAALLTGSIASQAVGQTPRRKVALRTLSAFEMEKAERLLSEKLPCLGCHELDGEGGRIGPSLSSLKDSLPPDYVFAMISDPQNTFPGTVMPRIPLMRKHTWSGSHFDYVPGPDGKARAVPERESIQETTLELIGSYLLQRDPSDDPTPARIPVAAAGPPPDTAGAATLYAHYCAACHGEEGEGDGPNARYLSVPPVSHADAEYMSERPDDSLFDAIYAGGYIMGLSHRMPAYGGTLSREQIWDLVRYLRRLCDCQGPPWSRDGR